MNQAEQIRDHFKRMGTSNAASCARALAMPIDAVQKCVQDLAEKGWLQRKNRGVYEYREVPDADRGHAAPLQVKMWRAVRINQSFTVRDVALYSGATLDYAKKYIEELRRRKLVKRIGTEGFKAIYACNPGIESETPVVHARRKAKTANPEQILDDAWALARAIRDGKRDEAREIHGRIGEMLK